MEKTLGTVEEDEGKHLGLVGKRGGNWVLGRKRGKHWELGRKRVENFGGWGGREGKHWGLSRKG